jgi:transposase
MLRRTKVGPVPEDTAAAARASFKRKPNVYMQFADTFGAEFDFTDFSELYSELGQSAIHPVRLLLLLMVAFLEGLSDKQVTEALAARIDLKYLLALPLDHPGYDASVLTEMRDRLIKGNLDSLLFDRILEFAEKSQLLKATKQRTDSTIILSAARRLTRLELVIETLTHALDVVSEVVPRLVAQVAASFEQRKAYEISGFQLRLPKKETDLIALADSVGRDGVRLLEALDSSPQAELLNDIDAIKTLRLVWAQQFRKDDDHGLKFRKPDELPSSADQVASPHDEDARFTAKRNEVKFGYSVHITETCTQGVPRLITNVLTTPATVGDTTSLPAIERSLRSRGLGPDEHLVDAGYTKAEYMLKTLEQYGTEIIGPLRRSTTWQTSRSDGFDPSKFRIDWDAETVECPEGKTSKSWRTRKSGSFEVRFDRKDCVTCPVRENCTKSEKLGRVLELKPRPLHSFIASQREYQKSDEFRRRYAPRAGVEGTMRRIKEQDVGRSRYFNLARTQLQQLFVAGAINAIRILRHICGTPLAETRRRAFARLMAAA